MKDLTRFTPKEMRENRKFLRENGIHSCDCSLADLKGDGEKYIIQGDYCFYIEGACKYKGVDNDRKSSEETGE